MAKNVQLNVEIKGSDSVGKAAEKTKSLKQELRELKNDLSSGKLTGKEFDEAAKRAGQLQDRIGDVNRRVKNLASDTGKLDGFVSIATGITGGFAAAQGAMALFGDENKDLQKQLVKVQGAVALLNGVQAVAATLNKDSAAMTSLNTVRLNILTFAQKRYTAAVGTTTGAMKLLRIAGMAIPIMLLVTGIGLLIANFDKVKDVVLKLLGPLGKLAKYIGGLVQQFTDFVGITSEAGRAFEKNESASNALIKSYDEQIAILEAMGGQEEKLYKIRLAKLNQDRLILMQKKMLNNASKEEIEKIDELATAIKVLKITEENRLKDVAKKESDATKKAAEERKKEQDAIEKAQKKRRDDLAKNIEEQLKETDRLEKERRQKEIKRLEFEEEMAEIEIAIQKKKDDEIMANRIAAEQQELQMKQNLEDAKIGIANQSAQFLQAIAGKQKGIALAALAVEKGAAIADVIIKGQRANATISALYPPPINIPYLVANNIRTGLSVATIAATGISGARNISGGGSVGSPTPTSQAPNIRGASTNFDPRPRQEPIKVFVAETDIRATQRRVDGIYSQATIR